jgi:hypothetical protein
VPNIGHLGQSPGLGGSMPGFSGDAVGIATGSGLLDGAAVGLPPLCRHAYTPLPAAKATTTAIAIVIHRPVRRRGSSGSLGRSRG